MRNLIPVTLAICVAGVVSAGITIKDKTGTGSTGESRDAQVGPDVVSFTIAEAWGYDMEYYGSSGDIAGYAIATQSCNVGDEEVDWYGGTNDVPVIAMNCYRLNDGRFEMIGLSWLKHSFCAVSEPGCGTCQSTPCSTLGIGCADTYWAGLNADATAPRSEINAATGYYDYPFSISPSGPNSVRGKLQLHHDDIDPALNSGAQYFIEGHYVTYDDALWGNAQNNASWREITFNSLTSTSPVTDTMVSQPAVQAWDAQDPAVTVRVVNVPDDGWIYYGFNVTDNGDGTWHYEYAIQNLNSDRSVDRVQVPVPECVTVTNMGFHDVDYHSGSPIDGTDWSQERGSDYVSWTTTSYESNEWANALRWGSLYNFRFDADVPATMGQSTLGLFKPGTPDSVQITMHIPDADCTPACAADVDDDGVVAVGDVLAVLAAWGNAGGAEDVDGDGTVAVGDLLAVIAAWGPCG